MENVSHQESLGRGILFHQNLQKLHENYKKRFKVFFGQNNGRKAGKFVWEGEAKFLGVAGIPLESHMSKLGS